MGAYRARVGLSASTGIFAKACAILFFFLQVPVASEFFSKEGFGVWASLTTSLVLLQFLDFGVGNGLVNLLSDERSSETKLNYVLNAFLLLTAVAIVLTALGLIIFYLFAVLCSDEPKLGGLDGRPAVILLFSLFIVFSLPFTVAQKVLWAQNKVYIANLYQAGASVLSYGVLLFISAGSLEEYLGIVAVSAVPFVHYVLLFLSVACIYRSKMSRASYTISMGMWGRLSTVGGQWAGYQAVFFIATSADALYVLYFIGETEAASYAMAVRIGNALALAPFFSLPLWPLYAQLVSQRLLVEAGRVALKYAILSLFFGLCAGLALLLFSNPLLSIMTNGEVQLGVGLLLSFAVWCVFYNLWAVVSSLLANQESMSELTLLALIACSVGMIIKIPMVVLLGAPGFSLGSVMIFAACCVFGIRLALSRLDTSLSALLLRKPVILS